MMNESFLGIFDDDETRAAGREPPAELGRRPGVAGPPVGREPSWAGLPSPSQLPASPGINLGRQPSWAEGPSIADAWDSVPTEHAPQGAVGRGRPAGGNPGHARGRSTHAIMGAGPT